MIYYYALLWAAVIIGQLFFAVVAVWIWQRKNPNINYFQALGVYFKKEVGTYIVVISATIMLSFILSDWLDLSLTRQDLLSKTELTRFEYWQTRFRTAATIFGTFAHFIAMLFFKGGQQAVTQYGQSKGIDINNN